MRTDKRYNNSYRRNRNNRNIKGKRMKKRKLNKKRVALALAILILLIMLIVKAFTKKDTVETASSNDNTQVSADNKINNPSNDVNESEEPTPPPVESPKKEITDWRIRLANSENILPEDFKVEVANIDKDKQFDARAIEYLNKMMNDMRKDKISNVWVQSAYRSVERQKQLYDNSVNKYLKQGKSKEEAERLTNEYINKPGASDHNLGLAVDFNNVDNTFENLKAFDWLQKNAENYGFVLRYPKDKEDVTKIAYESWHWRFVGEEHAKKMNELHMCLEEYIEYLLKN